MKNHPIPGCPSCGKWTEVVTTRGTRGGVYRRRECENGHRFTTYEIFDRSIFELRKVKAMI